MKGRIKTAVFISIGLLLVISIGFVLTRPPEDITAPGSHKLSFQFEGRKRTYELHIPLNYDEKRLTPLVISLHDRGDSLFYLKSLTGLTKKSDKEGFIVVYPVGIEETWNGPHCCGSAYENNINDVGFIRELMNRLQQQLKVDPGRIYVAGISNGAFMAYRLAAELSDRIAAIAAVAGTIGGKANEDAPLRIIAEPEQPVSVIIFHGTKDALVNYYGGLPDETGWGRRIDLSVAESADFWVEHNGCSKNPMTETSPDGKIIKDVYIGGTNGTEVVVYTHVDFGNGWPSTATDIIWEFFISHPKQ